MNSARRPLTTWIAGVMVLTAIWLLLWEDISVANVVSGILVATAAFAVLNRRIEPGTERIHVFAMLHLILWFSWQLVVASAVVAWEVLTPTLRVRQGIVEIDLRTDSKRVAALVANITSLIPGTLTLEVADDPPRLYVHVLHLNDLAAVRADTARLEELVVRAVAPSKLPLGPVGSVPPRHEEGASS